MFKKLLNIGKKILNPFKREYKSDGHNNNKENIWTAIPLQIGDARINSYYYAIRSRNVRTSTNFWLCRILASVVTRPYTNNINTMSLIHI